MKKLLIASTMVIASTLSQANVGDGKITSFTVTDITAESSTKSFRDQNVGGAMGGTQVGGARSGIIEVPLAPLGGGFPSQTPTANDKVGQVISTARDIVALGEAVYTLVQKGKPSNTTEYAPISVVPRDPMTKEYVDPFELENCSMPITKKFKASVKSGAKEVVSFEYMVVYSVGCQLNGVGSYISSAMVQPVSVKTSFGWDFTATMKLTGVMNHGSKAEPVAGAMLTMKYQMNSWSNSFEQNDTIHITGRGELKKY